MVLSDVWPSVGGGVLIGMSASLLILMRGRVASISSILEHTVERDFGRQYWRLVFLSGLLLPALFLDHEPLPANLTGPGAMLAAGLLVGAGAYLADGCISRHAVCGAACFSRSSLLATLLFVLGGVVSVYLLHLGGGALW